MTYSAKILKQIKARDCHMPLFQQAAHEVLSSIEPYLARHPEFEAQGVLERIVEPERVIMFRVPWIDDQGTVQVNRGYRVEFNSLLGPYKGGLRFHPSVTLDTLKFLGFEQIFKNALTGLSLGGGKGGSDFDPKGKSDREVMAFCQSFMTELFRHIGPDTDVPAGDIGVGGREIGYLFGQYKRLTNTFTGVLTGKDLLFGGSLIRTEATGYGLIYCIEALLDDYKLDTFANKTVAISGSGNVALFAAQKAQALGAKVITMSDSSGWIHDPLGIDLDIMKEIKLVERGRVSDYAKRMSHARFTPTSAASSAANRIWSVACDIALPCATQNELNLDDAHLLIKNGCSIVAEGANMPTTAEATRLFIDHGVHFIPGKAANAGGVATSGFEMSQNSMRLSWSADQVDAELKRTMQTIYRNISEAARKTECENDLVAGANIYGFSMIARAMIAQGVC